VTREEAAQAHQISRNLAAFHLDKLVDVGLLRARYETPADQPRGRGRTPKVYEPAEDDVMVSIPERRYEFVAEILAAAVAEPGEDVRATAMRIASERGRQLGQNITPRESTSDTLVAILADLGFEPVPEADRIVLRNCPFHGLAQRFPELVCGLNHAFVGAILEGLGSRLGTDLQPRPDACCVEIGPP
jgi:predicted ArsR family transcriptional regulator